MLVVFLYIHSCFNVARDSTKIEYIEAYLKANGMYRNYDDPNQDPVYSEVISCYHSDNFTLANFCFYGNSVD